MRIWWLAILLGVALTVDGAQAVILGGGGSSRKDCLMVFDAAVNYPPDNPKRFRCADGDSVRRRRDGERRLCVRRDGVREQQLQPDALHAGRRGLDHGRPCDRQRRPEVRSRLPGAAGPHQQRHRGTERSAEHRSRRLRVAEPVPRAGHRTARGQRVQARQEAGEDHGARRAGARPASPRTRTS